MHKTEITIFKLIITMKAQYDEPFWVVTLHFLKVCMFECIPFQTFEKVSQYFCILC
jgi:hypothetical protein